MTKKKAKGDGDGAPKRPTPQPKKRGKGSRKTPPPGSPEAEEAADVAAVLAAARGVSTTAATDQVVPPPDAPTAAELAVAEAAVADKAVEVVAAAPTAPVDTAAIIASEPVAEAGTGAGTTSADAVPPGGSSTALHVAPLSALPPLSGATPPPTPAPAPDELPPLPVEPAVETPRPPTAPPVVEAPPPAPAPMQIPAHAAPNAAAAALEAARIVSEIIDIDTPTGAVIAAAAAAGAAIEAVRGDVPLSDAHSGDPVTTVKLSRDRILRALEDPSRITATDTPAPRAPTDPGASANILTSATPPPPAATHEAGTAVDEPEEFEFDPVAIAAAAIQRLRIRTRTNFAQLRTQSSRLDLLVVLLALLVIGAAGAVHKQLVTPPTMSFPPQGEPDHGLSFEHSATWLRAEPQPLASPRLVHDLAPTGTSKPDTSYHVELTNSIDPTARIDVLIDKKPAWSNIVTGLDLDRRTRWGELYALDDSDVVSISGHQWLRTAYTYAHVNDKGDVPRVDHAVELATIDRDQIYVVTLFGSPGELDRIEDVVGPSLRVATPSALPLVPQTKLGSRPIPTPIQHAYDATVMVVVADVGPDGRLRARGGASGVIVGADGSILTNYHVVHDKDGRLHDVFIIGRFTSPDHPPQLQCAGRPSRSKLQRELDLALIKCDLDLDGRAWTPAQANGVWSTLQNATAEEIHGGQRLWVLGYPDVGGGGLTVYQGQIEGWSGENGAVGTDFIKTDAPITNGNSGGPVVDDMGHLVGIASAYRTKITASGGFVQTAQVGLVRPIAAASDLLAIASAGWTPLENHTDVDLAPSAVEPAATGVRISTKVLDTSNESPVRDALVMVLRPGVSASAVDVNRLDDQVLSWGRSNASGDVLLKQPVPVPGTYTVFVVARGYEPLIGENELHLDADTPPSYDPWGKIWLRGR